MPGDSDKPQHASPDEAPAEASPEQVVQAERRRWPRLNLRGKKMAVAWQSGSLRQVSYVASVALSGLFIDSHKTVPVGSMVKLLIETPAGDVRARAVVRRVVPGEGMGLSYVSMDYVDRARLYGLFKSVLK